MNSITKVNVEALERSKLMIFLVICGGAVTFQRRCLHRSRGEERGVYIMWIYSLPLKNIDAGDHILQCDGIPGPVSAARQPATDVDREK